MLFEQTHRARSVPYALGLISAFVITAIFTACAFGLAFSGQQRAGVSSLDPIWFFGMAGAGACVTAAGARAWMRNHSWTLCVSNSQMHWSSKQKWQNAMCADIESISIRISEAGDSMDVIMTDGTRRAVPRACLVGDLPRLCQVLRAHFPHIRVAYNGSPTCEVCGRPARTIVTDDDLRTSGELGGMATHYFCKVHKRKPIRETFGG